MSDPLKIFKVKLTQSVDLSRRLFYSMTVIRLFGNFRPLLQPKPCMLTQPNEAVKAILNNLKSKSSQKLPLGKAVGHVLHKDVKAPFHAPMFDNSAMDGYAYRFDDWQQGRSLNIVGVSSAGKPFSRRLKMHEAVRIYTGAAIPAGADTVVMQEKTNTSNKSLDILDAAIKKGANIRKAGSEIRKGQVALGKGSLLTPASCAFLASLGISDVTVHQKPSVAIVVTGNELVKPGESLKPGQIYESNSIALKHALLQEGITNIHIYQVKDNPVAMSRAFQKAVSQHNLVLFTGGISVGDYDFTESTFAKHRVKKVFYKLKQKPGKPIYFGVVKGKGVFGLPGNPASVMTCFYVYVIPALRALQSHPEKELPRLYLPLAHDYQRKPGMTGFMKAFTDFKSVKILDGQESYIMRSFAKANAMVVLPAADEKVLAQSVVETILLPI